MNKECEDCMCRTCARCYVCERGCLSIFCNGPNKKRTIKCIKCEDYKEEPKMNEAKSVISEGKRECGAEAPARSDILDEARKCVCSDRDIQYGDPEDNFGLIADFWSGYLNHPIEPRDVAAMMVLFKVARTKKSKKVDNWVDICGYAACGGEIDERTRI